MFYLGCAYLDNGCLSPLVMSAVLPLLLRQVRVRVSGFQGLRVGLRGCGVAGLRGLELCLGFKVRIRARVRVRVV